MKTLWAVLLAGCGGVENYEGICPGTAGFEEIYTESATNNCDDIRERIELAKKLLVGSGLTTDEEFTHIAGSTRLYVRQVADWEDPMVGGVQGDFNSFRGIRVNFTMSSLVHEFLHALQTAHAELSTYGHNDWNHNGYQGLDDFYYFLITDNIGEACWSVSLPETMVERLASKGWKVREWFAYRESVRGYYGCPGYKEPTTYDPYFYEQTK